MNIVTMLVENLLHGPVTLRFPERPLPAPRYRGLVEFDQTMCTGCATCAFVCTSAAIKFKSRRDTYEWSYDAGQCTFCGRCLDGCEAHAITMQASAPPIYLTSGELKHTHTLPRKKPGGGK
jgi:formate hydrogenlyase subunit 6/NADH:ubiquinone oxidoreductase subunit I